VNSAREGNPFADSNNFASRGIKTSGCLRERTRRHCLPQHRVPATGS
jgi:hypothetical protein